LPEGHKFAIIAPMKFKYKGLNGKWTTVHGKVEADSRKGAMQILAKNGVTVLSCDEIIGNKIFKLKIGRHDGTLKFSDSEMVHFLGKLANLCNGGLLLADVLESISKNSSSEKENLLSCQILEKLRDGNNFAQALKKCCNFFDDSILSVLELGDLTGKLPLALANTVASLRRKIETKKRFIAGLSYPLFICCVAFGVILLFLFYLMPRMEAMLRSFGGQLPLTARLLISCSRFFVRYFPIFFLLLLTAVIFLRYLYHFDKYRLIFDKFLFKIPAIGHLYTLLIRVRIANGLASLISGGVAISEAVNMVARSIANTFFRQNYIEARDAILDGAALASAFKTYKIFDGSEADIIAVGEKIGNVAVHFATIGEIYDAQLSDFLKKLVTITSSAALLFAFAIVAILALSIVSTVLNFSAKLAH
jgi:general secretion pathway protein F